MCRSINLRQLQSAVKYFIDGYWSLKLPALSTSSTRATSDLSTTELARPQRAFYRYDICQTMWHYPGRFHNHWDHKTSRCQPRTLFTKLNHWEIGEVNCKNLERDYLIPTCPLSQSKSDGLSTQTRLKQDLVAPKSRSDEGQDDFIFSEWGKIYEKEHITL